MRTRKKAILRARRMSYIALHSKKLVYDVERDSFGEVFCAPTVFSFIEDPKGTTEFFENFTSFVIQERNFGQRIFVDMSQIEILTIDALMYLLALMDNFSQDIRTKYTFAGCFPKDPTINTLMRDAGFSRFVKSKEKKPIERNTNNIQIVSGEKVDVLLAKRMCDFLIRKGKTTKVACRFLYNMMIELMANVYAHAYTETHDFLSSQWYCFAECDPSGNTVNFTFMDTGDGIPSTVRKHGLEHIDVLNLTGDGPYVISALRGELRSKTRQAYRGKGLPKIFSFCQNNLIKNVRIITDKADISVIGAEPVSNELSTPLRGTLFYWQITLSDLTKEVA